jgi:hypothetical protein
VDRKINQPSEETKRKILEFFMENSVPKILREEKESDCDKKG